MRLKIFIVCGVLCAGFLCQASEPVKKEEKKDGKSSIPDNIQIPIEAKKTDAEMEELGNLLLKGIEHEGQKKYADAIECYSKALKIDEESAMALIRRGICFIKINRPKEAADDIWAGLHQKPKTVGDFAAIAWVRAVSPLKNFRDGSVAVAYGKRAVKESESAYHYDVLAAGYAEMGNFEMAKNMLEKAVKYFPEDDLIPSIQNRIKLFKEKKKYREDWGVKPED